MPGEIMGNEIQRELKLKIKKIIGDDRERWEGFDLLCGRLSNSRLSTEAGLSPTIHQPWPEDVYGFILHRINIAHREREGLCRNFERGPTVPVWYEEKTSKLKRKLEKIKERERVVACIDIRFYTPRQLEICRHERVRHDCERQYAESDRDNFLDGIISIHRNPEIREQKRQECEKLFKKISEKFCKPPFIPYADELETVTVGRPEDGWINGLVEKVAGILHTGAKMELTKSFKCVQAILLIVFEESHTVSALRLRWKRIQKKIQENPPPIDPLNPHK